MQYKYGAYPQEMSKTIDINVISIGFEKWLSQENQNQSYSSTFAMGVDGIRLKPDASFGNACHNPIDTKITPISGSNWAGWMAEDTYAKSQSKEGYCKIYSPEYCCIHLVIGNKKMSAELGGACLLRKRTTSLEQGLSYEIFKEMIKTINFNEE